MSYEQMFPTWVSFTRDSLKYGILPLNHAAVDWPWDQLVFDEVFLDTGNQNEIKQAIRLWNTKLDDFAVRFTLLGILKVLYTYDTSSYETDQFDESQFNEVKESFFEIFRETFHLLKPDLLDTWHRIEWELEVARCADDWEISDLLWSVAAARVPDANREIELLKAQYHFAEAFGGPIFIKRASRTPRSGSVFQDLDDYSSRFFELVEEKGVEGDVIFALLRNEVSSLQKWPANALFEYFRIWCLQTICTDSTFSTEQTFHAFRVTEAFAKTRPSLMTQAHLCAWMLCAVALRDFNSAQTLIKNLPSPKLRVEFESRAIIASANGDTEHAIQLLQTAADSFTAATGLYLRLKGIAQRTLADHQRAAEYMKKETERNAEYAEKDDVSTAVALYAISSPSVNMAARLNSFLESPAAETVTRIVELYWPEFRFLRKESASAWITALYEGWIASVEEKRIAQNLRQDAVRNFSLVVETELRSVIFASAKPPVSSLASSEIGTRIKEFLDGKRQLSLGDMVLTLQSSSLRCPMVQSVLLRANSAGVNNENIKQLESLRKLRNAASHEIAESDHNAAHTYAKNVLNVLTRGRRGSIA